jgi:hypothetical protein
LMVSSATEISYEVRFVCAISCGMRMVTGEKGHLEAVLFFALLLFHDRSKQCMSSSN